MDARAKKSLGQHFLNDTDTLEQIAAQAQITAKDVVVEIGPGRGSLTRVLLKRASSVVAIEKDAHMVQELEHTFEDELKAERLTLIEDDALSFDLSRIDQAYKVVANIPYYITGKLLRRLFSGDPLPETIVLLLQKEVAERIVSEKKESLLSLSVKAYGEPRYCFDVPRELFSPEPEVDSAVVAIEHISRDFFDDIDEKQFFSILKKAFTQKRKTLLNSLFSYAKETGQHVFAEVGISGQERPESIPKNTWKHILQALERNADL